MKNCLRYFGELAVELAKGFASRSGGLLGAVKILAPHRMSIAVNSPLPFSVMGAETNSNKTRGVIRLPFSIPAIFSMGCITQVLYSVIRGVATDMVDKSRWPYAVDVKPCKAVGGITSNSFNSDLDITADVAPGCFASVPRIPLLAAVRSVSPSENASGRIVIQKRSYQISRQSKLGLRRHGIPHVWPMSNTLTEAATGFNHRRA